MNDLPARREERIRVCVSRLHMDANRRMTIPVLRQGFGHSLLNDSPRSLFSVACVLRREISVRCQMSLVEVRRKKQNKGVIDHAAEVLQHSAKVSVLKRSSRPVNESAEIEACVSYRMLHYTIKAKIGKWKMAFHLVLGRHFFPSSRRETTAQQLSERPRMPSFLLKGYRHGRRADWGDKGGRKKINNIPHKTARRKTDVIHHASTMRAVCAATCP